MDRSPSSPALRKPTADDAAWGSRPQPWAPPVARNRPSTDGDEIVAEEIISAPSCLGVQSIRQHGRYVIANGAGQDIGRLPHLGIVRGVMHHINQLQPPLPGEITLQGDLGRQAENLGPRNSILDPQAGCGCDAFRQHDDLVLAVLRRLVAIVRDGALR